MSVDIPSTPRISRRSAKDEAYIRASPISPSFFEEGDMADPAHPRSAPLSPLHFQRTTNPSRAVTPKGMRKFARAKSTPSAREYDSGSDDEDCLMSTPARGGGAGDLLKKCLSERKRRQAETLQKVLRTAEKGKGRAVEEEEDEEEEDEGLASGAESAPSTPHRHQHASMIKRHVRRQFTTTTTTTTTVDVFTDAPSTTATRVPRTPLIRPTMDPAAASIASVSALAASVSMALNSAASAVNGRELSASSVLAQSVSSALSEAVVAVNSRSSVEAISRSALAVPISSALSVAAGAIYSRTETATPQSTATTAASPSSVVSSSVANSAISSSSVANSASGASSSGASSVSSSSSGTSSSSSGASAPSAVSNVSSSHNDLVKKVVPAVVIPVVIIGLILILCCCFRRKKRPNSQEMKSPGSFGATQGSSGAAAGILSPTSNPMSMQDSQGSFATTQSAAGIGRAIGEPQTRWGRRSLLDVMAGALAVTNGKQRATSGSSFGHDASEDETEQIRYVGRQRSMASFSSETSSARGVGGYNSMGGYQPGQNRPVVPPPIIGGYHHDPFSGPGIVPVREADEGQRESYTTDTTATTAGRYSEAEDSEDDYRQATAALGGLPAAEASRTTQATATGDEAYYTDTGSIATETGTERGTNSVMSPGNGQYGSTGSEAGTEATPTMSNWRDSSRIDSQSATPVPNQEILRSPGKEGTWW